MPGDQHSVMLAEGCLDDEKQQSKLPSLQKWILPALACAALYAFYNIFIKQGSAYIHPILGGVILQFVAAVLGASLLLVVVLSAETSSEKLQYDREGLIWSVCAGVAVGVAEMLSFYVSGLGVPATQSIPIIIGGNVLFGAGLGLMLLGEKLKLHGWLGVVLLVIGIAFVTVDPGGRLDEKASPIPASSLSEGRPPTFWIVTALVCALAYAFYNIFIKMGSSSINAILGGVILQLVSAIFGTVLLGAIIFKDCGVHNLNCSRTGVFFSVWAGLSVGTAEMLSFCVSGMGVNATQSIPVIIGGNVLVGTVLGIMVLGEAMGMQGWVGVGILTVGITVVATDPGENIEGHKDDSDQSTDHGDDADSSAGGEA